ncbi:MAG: HAD family hydrolase [Deltaproteobacteria bacterium]|nr:HAD family hydrolase [Deltaproteobacteria bacterium]
MPARVAAFFDIDKTVLEINSGTKWIAYMRRTGQMGVVELARALKWLLQYRFGLLDYEAMATRVLQAYAGKQVAPLAREIEQWFLDEVRWAICVEARERIARHRDAGETVVLLTSATQFMTQPLARELDIEHMLCTTIEVEGEHFTGRHVRPACYGAGKVHYAEAYARAHDVALERSYFYSDSYTDLPMLERVGHPVVVNPDPRLRRVASQRGWPIEIWRAPVSTPSKDTNDVGFRAG